jgi:cysteine desulfurase csdAE, sulfur acceptor subunit
MSVGSAGLGRNRPAQCGARDETHRSTPKTLRSIKNMTINEIQDEIIEEFSEIEDWMDRYQLIIDLGEEGDVLPASEKNESNLIDGCQSRVWIVCDQQADGTLVFRGESDALIVKGLVCLLLRVVNGHTPEEIRDADLYFIPKIGLAENLSPTRSNGLLAMIKRIKAYAVALSA